MIAAKTSKPKELSPTMKEAVEHARQHGGKLVRLPGGFWTAPDAPIKPWWGTTTVQALVTRGAAAYTKYQEGANGKFPVEATITDA